MADNPQAFPSAPDGIQPEYGMTLRDWFAGQAFGELIQLVSRGALAAEGDETNAQNVARSSYEFADAMLAAREGKQ